MISTGRINVRYYDEKFLFNVAGISCFPEENNRNYLLAFLNTNVAQTYVHIINPTINLNVGDVARLPIIFNYKSKTRIDILVEKNIKLSKTDWDSFETSWEFKTHPYINGGSTIAESHNIWENNSDNRYNQLKNNEEELNQIFIDTYGVGDEIFPVVEDKEITINKADFKREIKSFISYGIGCLLGRYSLDVEGIAYAGGPWDNSKYNILKPDNDNILPITDREYFQNDIVRLFISFLKKAYSYKSLEENLEFISDGLEGTSDYSLEIIRNYFIKDFFKDHCKIYQNRPIYWLFSSGKEKAFQALVYLHRYNSGTLARLRTEYVILYLGLIQRQIENLQKDQSSSSVAVMVKIQKEINKLEKQKEELISFDEKLKNFADKRIELDLDDGVKVNYGKFGDLLAEVKQVTGK